MVQKLETKTPNIEDIKFLKRELKKGYTIFFIFSIFSIIFPGFCIYQIFINPEITEKTIAIFAVLICLGFWSYVTIVGIKKTIIEQQNLNLQKKIEGNVIVLNKEIIIIKGDESNDTYSYELKIYSEIEEKHKNISILEKYYEKIQIGDYIWIEYFLDCNYIKAIIFKELNIKDKNFCK